MAKQLTLFGNVAPKEIDKKNYVYKSPVGRYQCFVERFFQRNKKSGRPKQALVTEAQDLWKKQSEEEKQSFEALLPGEKSVVIKTQTTVNTAEPSNENSKADDGWFRRDSSTDSATSSSSRQSADVIVVRPADGGQSSSQTLPSSPNVASAIHGGGREHYLKENEKAQVVTFLEALCPPIVTEDVINNDAFITAAASCAKAYDYYQELSQEYRQQVLRKGRASKLSSKRKEIEDVMKDIRSKLEEASEIDLNLSSGTSALAFKAILKQKLLSEVIARCVKAQSKLADVELLQALRRRISQQKQVKSRPFTRDSQEQLTFECQNTETLSWEEVFVNLELMPDGVMSALQMRDLALVLEETLCVSVCDIVQAFSIASENVDETLAAIIKNFPVVRVGNTRVEILINLHEMVLCPDIFEELLALNEQPKPDPARVKPTTGDQGKTSTNVEPQDQQTEVREKVTKAGRPSLVSKFPDIIPRTTELLKQHSFMAESRRRTSTATGNGVSLAEIREHLYRTVPGLKEHGMSRDTIHSLFVPPRKGTLRAQNYKGHIDAKVPGKSNSYRENHADSHFLFARVAYRQELASKFPDEVTVLSADDMNKIKVGQAAVSRYHQISRFFMADDSPNFPDHDFPHPNYLLVPSGYMFLQRHQSPENEFELDSEEVRALIDVATNDTLAEIQDQQEPQSQPSVQSEFPTSSSEATELDKLGRPHLPRPRTGPAKVILRSTKFSHSSSQVHANDLRLILEAEVQKGKTVAFILTDNGPDWQTSSLCNLLYFMRVWRDTGLDMLLLCSFAARHSAYNPIEHLWSPLSKHLAGVILPAKLPGEDKAPCQQRLTEAEQRQKEAKVFDNAMGEICDDFWKGHTFDGFPVSAQAIPCIPDEDDESLYSDYNDVHKLIRGPIRNVRGTELLKELRFMLDHLDRKKNEVVLKKCTDPECNHCSGRPVVATKVFSFLNERKLFNPMTSDANPGHYCTFLEMCERPSVNDLPEGDEGIPTGSVGKCGNCKSFCFSSKTEMQRHQSIFHRRPPKEKGTDKRHICRYKIAAVDASEERECGLEFPSAYKLAQHRRQTGHTKRRRSRQTDPVPAKRQKQADQPDGGGDGRSNGDDGQSGDEIERCAVCALTDEDEVEGDRGWIECDDCGSWYHLHCLPDDCETPDMENLDISNIHWSCYKCI